jgi:hypothetical protein
VVSSVQERRSSCAVYNRGLEDKPLVVFIGRAVNADTITLNRVAIRPGDRSFETDEFDASGQCVMSKDKEVISCQARLADGRVIIGEIENRSQTENQAASTTTLLAPFVGIWSNTQEGCKMLKQGALDKMDIHHATQFGIVEVSTKGVDWIYTSGGVARCSFAQDKTRADGKQIIAPIFCAASDGDMRDGDTNSEPHMNMVFSAISTTAMHMQYIADDGNKSEYYTKVRCR